jgi:NDP-sugar pyrophosphorylase family protein
MQAVILCGGEGTRLRPLTYKIPKPMVPIASRPFLFHLVKNLKKNKITDLVFLVGYLPKEITGFFGNGRKFGVKIKYSKEKKLLGTAGALKNAKKFLKNEFVLLFGDTFQDIDFNKMEKQFRKSKKLAMVVAYDNGKKVAKNNFKIKNKLVLKYVKKGCRECNFVDAGTIMMKKEVLKMIPTGKVSLEKEIYPKLIAKKQLAAFCTRERYYDIGTPERIKKFERYLKTCKAGTNAQRSCASSIPSEARNRTPYSRGQAGK